MIYWLWLNNISGLGPILSKILLERYRTPVRIYKCTEEELLSIKGIGNKLAGSILSNRCLDEAKSQLTELRENNIKLLTYTDHRYPTHAKTYHKAPILLYYQGTIKSHVNNIAIVGNESFTSYSETVTTRAILHLIKTNYTLISGLSKGVESLAHHQFTSNQGYQIAFVPHGLDVYYPVRNRRLIKQIIANGAVISEHPLGTKPIKAFFLKKNALVASWSNQLLLVEAHKKANALGIIRTAKELQKPIFVVPHELNKKHAEGSNIVLSEGAQLYLEAIQLTPDYVPDISPMIKPSSTNSDESKVIKALEASTKTVNELAFELQLPLLKVIEIMTILELESHVIQLPGTKYKLV